MFNASPRRLSPPGQSAFRILVALGVLSLTLTTQLTLVYGHLLLR